MADMGEKEKALIIEIESLRQRVAELEHCEKERKRTEEILLNLFNATEEVVFLMDREGIILMANTNAAFLYDVPMEKLPGRSIYDFISSDRVKSGRKR